MPPEDASHSSRLLSFSLSDEEFETIRRLVKAQTGISLGLHKRELVVSRLSRRLRALGLKSFAEYIQLLKEAGDSGELVHMINQITTNKTDFYREKHHFDFLSNTVLPKLYAEGERTGNRRIRCWSAGCSSGEEPYTMAITMAEFFKDRPGWDIKILATDLDTAMLRKASKGEYPAEAVEPIPKPILTRYFEKRVHDGEVFYVVKPQLRKMIVFRRFNLMAPRYPFKIQLDFIFCRNVLIYFDHDDKIAVVKKFHSVLKPGGYLFVGHSESLMAAKDLFRYVATTVYQKI